MITNLSSHFNSDYRSIKSTKRPEPPELPRPEVLHTNTTVSKAAEDRDLVWKLARNVIGNQQHVPAWSSFNAFTSDSACSVASVLYMPFIRESASDLSTIYTSMIRLVRLAAELGQHHILVTLIFIVKLNRSCGENHIDHNETGRYAYHDGLPCEHRKALWRWGTLGHTN